MPKKSTILLVIAILSLLIFIGIGLSIALREPNSPDISQNVPKSTVSFTMDEVSRHNSRQDCWSVIYGNVYDLTKYINRHPGGNEILRACGQDATTLFTERLTSVGKSIGSGSEHSQTAKDQLELLKIGLVKK